MRDDPKCALCGVSLFINIPFHRLMALIFGAVCESCTKKVKDERAIKKET